MMDTNQINSVLCSHAITSPIFRGTFPSDLLPRYLLPRPSILVANSDTSDKEGEHSVAFVLPTSNNSVVEFFDSFGLKPQVRSFQSFMKRNGTICVSNTHHLQHVLSDTCGLYVCVYVLYRCMGYSLMQFQAMFGKDLIDNDNLVRDLFRLHFTSCLSSPGGDTLHPASSYCGRVQRGR
jgi:hypothetical protein